MHEGRWRWWRPGRLALALWLACLTAAAAGEGSYQEQIDRWRAAREARLTAEDGWLAVAGLFWLHEGDNTFGTGPDRAIVLPEGSAPARAGSFTLANGRTVLTLAPGVAGEVDAKPVTASIPLRSDAAGAPDVLRLGRLRLYVIERGDRYGIRLKDPESRDAPELHRPSLVPGRRALPRRRPLRTLTIRPRS